MDEDGGDKVKYPENTSKMDEEMRLGYEELRTLESKYNKKMRKYTNQFKFQSCTIIATEKNN